MRGEDFAPAVAGAAPNAARHDLRTHDLRTMAILSTLLAFASISTDLYLPAMPAMGLALHANEGAVALTVASYLTGFSLGQLVWGPVSDRYGRRGPIAVGWCCSFSARPVAPWRAASAP